MLFVGIFIAAHFVVVAGQAATWWTATGATATTTGPPATRAPEGWAVTTASWLFLCPDGFTRHHDNCYIYMHEPYNWFDAEVACWTMGARLVEIGSADENQYVAGLVRNQGVQAWIGAQDLAEEGVFVYPSTHHRISFHQWALHEPNDDAHQADCVYISGDSGEWADTHCERTTHPFVCEMPMNGEQLVVPIRPIIGK